MEEKQSVFRAGEIGAATLAFISAPGPGGAQEVSRFCFPESKSCIFSASLNLGKRTQLSPG